MPDDSRTDVRPEGRYERAHLVPAEEDKTPTDSTNTVVRTVVVKSGSSRVVLRYAPHSTHVPPDETSGG